MKNVFLYLGLATMLGIVFDWFLLQLICEVAWAMLGFFALAFVSTPRSDYCDDFYRD